MKSPVIHFIGLLLLLIMIILPAGAANESGTAAQPTATAENVTAAESVTPAGTATTAKPGTAEPDAVNESGTTDTSGSAEGTPLMLQEAILWAFVGIFTSFIIPVLKKYAAKVIGVAKGNQTVDHWKEFWDAVSPYVATTLLSALMAVVVVAILYSENTPMTQWYVPFLAGYLFDATVQKVKPGKDDPV